VQQAYRALVGRDRAVSHSEFWRLSPAEVWWLIEARQPQQTFGKKHPMGAAEVQAIAYQREADREEAEAAGFSSVAEFWRHRARERDGNG